MRDAVTDPHQCESGQRKQVLLVVLLQCRPSVHSDGFVSCPV